MVLSICKKHLGLLSVAAMLPSEWEKRLVDLNVTDRGLALQVVADGRDVRSTKVADVMTHKIITCRADGEVQRAVDAMVKHPLRRMPVVDNDYRIIGIIAQADVVTRIDHWKKLPKWLRKFRNQWHSVSPCAPVGHAERRQIFRPSVLACSAA